MPIIQQPAFDELPAYRPVKFEAFQFFTNPEPIENAVVTILQAGVPIGPAIRFKVVRTVSPSVFGAPFTDYYFEIDIQKYIQDYLGPNAGYDIFDTVFVDPAGFGAILNSSLYGLFSISITYEYIDSATGLLEPLVQPPDVSNEFYVYSIARQCTAPFFEQMDLSDYTGQPFAFNTKFLTKGETTVDICEDDQAFLSVIQTNSFDPFAAFEVKLYDVNDVLLSSGYALTVFAPAFSAELSLNTSVASLAAQPYLVGAPNFADPNLAYYTVTMGYLIAVPGPDLYIQQTEEFRYNIVGKCCGLRELRLHWFNLLGGSDSYTFKSTKALNLKTESDRAEKSLDWIIGSTTPHNVSDVGKFKIKSEATPSYNLTSKLLTNEQAVWMSELLTSPEVYAEIEGELVPVTIENTDQVISRQNGKIVYEVEATLANDWIIQRI